MEAETRGGRDLKPTDPSSGSILTSASEQKHRVTYTLSAEAGHYGVHGGMAVMRAGVIEGGDTLQGIATVRFTATGTLTDAPAEPTRPARIDRPPGEGAIRWFAGFFCSPETAERRFGQLLVDMRLEYRAALSRGRRMQARWIVLKYWAGFMGQLLAPFGPVLDWIEKTLRIIEKVLSIIEKVSNLLR